MSPRPAPTNTNAATTRKEAGNDKAIISKANPFLQFPVRRALVPLVGIDQGGETRCQPYRAAEYFSGLSHN